MQITLQPDNYVNFSNAMSFEVMQFCSLQHIFLSP